MGKEKELKVGMITKRAQQRKSISRTNYKERVFVLTQSHLAYYDGNIKQRGKVKGRFSLDTVSFVGDVYDSALNRTSTFLIIHDGCYLYCCAKNLTDRDEWILAIKQACQQNGNTMIGRRKFHPKIYSHKKWQCCGQIQKNSEGCQLINEHDENRLSILDAAIAGYQFSHSAPGSPLQSQKGHSSRFKFGSNDISLSSSLENTSFHSLDDVTEHQKMFKDFETAWSENLSIEPNLLTTKLSARAKSDSFLPQNGSVSGLPIKPFPVRPRLQQSQTNSSYSNPGDTSTIASCCTILFNGDQNSPVSQPVPPPIPVVRVSEESCRSVVAVYDYEPTQPEDISLVAGEKYQVVDDSRAHWWIVRSDEGLEGFVPANYVKDKKSDGLESMSWFQLDMSRQRAEYILKQDGKEGGFIVRKSTQDNVIYSVSVLSRCGKATAEPTVRHYHVKKDEDTGQFYFSKKHLMSTILELIEYHKYDAGGLVTRLRHAPRRLEHPDNQPTTHLFSNSKWEMKIDDLEMISELGSGQFGVVNLAKYRGRNYVAVKIMKENTMQEESFIEEAEVMTKLQHKNLVELYGVVTNRRPICIVTEYLEEGCMLNYIRAQPSLHTHADILLDISCQICDAMKYLESKSVIHRDLAARNCLVGRNMLVKVGDFGLARYVLDDEYTSSVGGKFPIKWAAPEVLNYTRFSSRSDVWSFGVVIWELFTGGKVPYTLMTNSEVASRITQGYRLDRPPTCPHDVYNLMRRTWHEDEAQRPAFSVLYDELYHINDAINAACVPAGMQYT